jgi:mono/diheme cytochrome c family protein
MRKSLIILLVIFISSSASAQDIEKLFREKCGRCHSIERPLNKTKDLEEWKRTVRRMAGYTDGAISEEEQKKIAEYLAGRNKTKKTRTRKTPEKQETGVPAEHEMFNFKKVRVEQFIDPSVCGDCHSEIYEQWSGSMHSKAYTDPLWRAATKLFFRDAREEGEILEMKACIKCHTPLGFRSDSLTSPAEDFDKLAELPAQGIFCNWCHNINEVKHIGDAGYEVAPGGGEDDPSTMLGPFKDAYSDFHPTKYSELHTRSEFCGLCHNVSHAANKLPIETTYDEWKNSPYNTGDPETTVNCQDCHMRQRPGIPATGKTARPDNPGTAADSGPERPHIWTHYFVGGNTVVTKLTGSGLHSKMAVERLRNAADMEIIKNGQYKKNNIAFIEVKVTNSGAGHYLPTGITEVRQMWLDVEINDAKGKTVFRSGALDKNGKIDKDTVMYYTQLGNKKGEPVINVALADRILHDHRIPPKGFVIEKYAFHIPQRAASPLSIKAALKYRSVSQELANTLLGKDAPEIPVVEMVSSVKKIKLR